jgi:hypothetical protein
MWRVLITDIEPSVWQLISAASHLQLYCVRWKRKSISSKPHNKRSFYLVLGQVKINILGAPDASKYDNIFRRNIKKRLPNDETSFPRREEPSVWNLWLHKKTQFFPFPKDRILNINLFLLPACFSLILRIADICCCTPIVFWTTITV